MKKALKQSNISRENESVVVGGSLSGISPKNIDVIQQNYLGHEFEKANNLITELIFVILADVIKNSGYKIGKKLEISLNF